MLGKPYETPLFPTKTLYPWMTLILSYTSHFPWKSIPRNTPGENYSNIRELADLSVCVNKYQQAFWRCCRGTVAVLESNQVIHVSFFSFSHHLMHPTTNTIPTTWIPLLSLNTPLQRANHWNRHNHHIPILTNGYELHP